MKNSVGTVDRGREVHKEDNKKGRNRKAPRRGRFRLFFIRLSICRKRDRSMGIPRDSRGWMTPA